MKTIEYTLPAFWASALINGDYTGLSDEDEAELEAWLESESDAINGDCLNVSDEPEFRPYNDAGTLACDCLTYTFIAKA